MTNAIRPGWAQDETRLLNFRATREDQLIIERLGVSSERGLSFIIRRAIRALTIDSLLRPPMHLSEAQDDEGE